MLEMQDLINFLHLCEEPFFCRIKSMKVQLILSKAFSMSSLITKPFDFFIFQKSTASLAIIIAYVICLSLTKAI